MDKSVYHLRAKEVKLFPCANNFINLFNIKRYYRRMIVRILLCLVSFLFLCSQGLTTPILLEKYKGWCSYGFNVNPHKDIRYLVTQPTNQEGTYDRRGPCWFFVFKRKGCEPQIMFDLGYQTAEKGTFAAVFDSEKKYILIPKGTKIYLDKRHTKEFCEDMKKNENLSLFGVSSKQNKIIDRYKLAGFTYLFTKFLRE